MKIKVLVFPKDVNPYLELLYSHMDNDVVIEYFQNKRKPKILNMLLTPFELTYFRLKGFRILHFHWPFPFRFSDRNNVTMALSEFYLNLFLFSLKIIGFKLIWTVHDLLPHEKTFRDDEAISHKLTTIASELIVLNSDTKETLVTSYKISAEKISLIPLGNYIGYYPNSLKKIKRTGTYFLFFGQVKPYKGIEELISTFKLLSKSDIDLKILGKCIDKKYFKTLTDLVGNNDKIHIENKFTPNNLIGDVFSLADVLVLPFREITNSSSAILAFSMKTPIIAPLIGMIKDFPQNTGFYYELNDAKGLQKSIIKVTKSKEMLLQMSNNAYSYAETLDQKKIAKETIKVYEKIIRTNEEFF